jgi:hypothetical protein
MNSAPIPRSGNASERASPARGSDRTSGKPHGPHHVFDRHGAVRSTLAGTGRARIRGPRAGPQAQRRFGRCPACHRPACAHLAGGADAPGRWPRPVAASANVTDRLASLAAAPDSAFGPTARWQRPVRRQPAGMGQLVPAHAPARARPTPAAFRASAVGLGGRGPGPADARGLGCTLKKRQSADHIAQGRRAGAELSAGSAAAACCAPARSWPASRGSAHPGHGAHGWPSRSGRSHACRPCPRWPVAHRR